ncbi:MAG: hypothetical protein ACXVXI_03990 [Mycobacteriaceae bacterium]
MSPHCVISVRPALVVLPMTFAFILDTRMERQHKLDLLGVAIATAAVLPDLHPD